MPGVAPQHEDMAWTSESIDGRVYMHSRLFLSQNTIQTAPFLGHGPITYHHCVHWQRQHSR